MYTTLNQVRRAFWLTRGWSGFKGWDSVQNDYNPTIRSEFVDYVDYLHRSGVISDKLSKTVTL